MPFSLNARAAWRPEVHRGAIEAEVACSGQGYQGARARRGRRAHRREPVIQCSRRGAQGAFSAGDGFAIKLAVTEGITVAILSGRLAGPVKPRLSDLGIPRELTVQGSRDKRADLVKLASRMGLTLAEIAFMGDDLADLPALTTVGLAAGPADAVKEVRGRCHFVAGAPRRSWRCPGTGAAPARGKGPLVTGGGRMGRWYRRSFLLWQGQEAPRPGCRQSVTRRGLAADQRHSPQPLQEMVAGNSSRQAPHRTWVEPLFRIPQSRYAATALSVTHHREPRRLSQRSSHCPGTSPQSTSTRRYNGVPCGARRR